VPCASFAAQAFASHSHFSNESQQQLQILGLTPLQPSRIYQSQGIGMLAGAFGSVWCGGGVVMVPLQMLSWESINAVRTSLGAVTLISIWALDVTPYQAMCSGWLVYLGVEVCVEPGRSTAPAQAMQ